MPCFSRIGAVIDSHSHALVALVIREFSWIVRKVKNPLQIILQKRKKGEEEGLTTTVAYSLQLPLTVSTTAVVMDSLGRLQVQFKVPELVISSNLLRKQQNIVRWNDVVFIHCFGQSPTGSFSIPPFITLPGNQESEKTSKLPIKSIHENFPVYSYSIRTIASLENDQLVVYKRLFPSTYHHALKKTIYDIHRCGSWIRVENESVRETSWKQVQTVSPLWIYYEKVQFSRKTWFMYYMDSFSFF